MVAAFHDGNGGYQSQLCFSLQVGQGQHTAVAHGGLDLIKAGFHIIMERTCVGYDKTMEVLSYKVGDLKASDHYPVECSFKWK